MSDIATIPVIVWTNRQQVPLIQRLLEAQDGWAITAAGGPSRAHLRHLNDEVDFPCYDDLRQLIMEHTEAILVLASTEGLQRKHLELLIEHQIKVCCLEMPVANIADAKYLDAAQQSALFRLCPSFKLQETYQAAMDPELGMDLREAMNLILLSKLGSISLFTRLCEAIETVISIMGMPTAINATLTGPLGETDNPRSLTGHITANLSFEDRASAALLVSDRSGSFSRQITICSTAHQLWLNDEGYTLLDQAGQEIDKQYNQEAKSLIDQIIESWEAWEQASTEMTYTDILACCHAILLSCKTGESESPQRLATIQ